MKYEEPKMEVIAFSQDNFLVNSSGFPEGGFEDM